jgi:tetratricopeptide (TPR) repeat protein
MSSQSFLTYLVLILLLACFVLPVAADAAESDEAAEGLLAGRVLVRSGRYFEAMERLESALIRADQTGRHLTAALALSNMAEIQRIHGNTADAARYYGRALANYRVIGHRDGIAWSQKKIEELTGTAVPPDLTASDQDALIDRAVERVRKRLNKKSPASE